MLPRWSFPTLSHCEGSGKKVLTCQGNLLKCATPFISLHQAKQARLKLTSLRESAKETRDTHIVSTVPNSLCLATSGDLRGINL